MDIKNANEILDAVDNLSAVAAQIIGMVLSATGKQSVEEIRAERDKISADTHDFLDSEEERVKGDTAPLPSP